MRNAVAEFLMQALQPAGNRRSHFGLSAHEHGNVFFGARFPTVAVRHVLELLNFGTLSS